MIISGTNAARVLDGERAATSDELTVAVLSTTATVTSAAPIANGEAGTGGVVGPAVLSALATIRSDFGEGSAVCGVSRAPGRGDER